MIRNRGRDQSGDSASDVQPRGNEVANRTNLLRCMSPELALFGRDRRVGECLLLREERKSGLRGPISVFGGEADLIRSPADVG